MPLNQVAEVPLRAIWLWRLQKNVNRSLDRADRDTMSGSDAKRRLTTGDSIVHGLHRTLMPLLNNHYTSSLMYRPCCKRLNQGKKPFNTGFSILHDEKTLQLCRNVSGSQLNVALWTRPHPEKHCIISWGLMLSPCCGPSATNHMNCWLIEWKSRHRNFYCIVLNVFSILETTEILIIIDVVCEVGNSLETPCNVIL